MRNEAKKRVRIQCDIQPFTSGINIPCAHKASNGSSIDNDSPSSLCKVQDSDSVAWEEDNKDEK
jgi:hypothetical protein